MTGEPSTHDLVVGAQAGDEAAREALFRRYLPRVAHMVAVQFGVSRDALPAHAEDVAQEAIVRALGSLGQFEMRGRGAFAAWLAAIVENCVRQQWRSRNGSGERRFWRRYGDLDLHESFFAGSEMSPSRTFAREDVNRAIESSLLKLPALYRQVLSLRFFAAMTHAEIAERIGHTESNSRKLVQRALEALRIEVARPGT